MAKQTLPTDFKDDILSASMNGKRRYIFTQNSDGTWSLEDVTTYNQVGDVLGAARLNALCKAVNESVDQAKAIESVETLAALTEAGYVVGGQAGAAMLSVLHALNDSGAVKGLEVKENGVYITYTLPGGADTVTKKLGKPETLVASGSGDNTYDLSGIPGYANLEAEDFLLTVTGISATASAYSHDYAINKECVVDLQSPSLTYDAASGALTVTGAEKTDMVGDSSSYGGFWVKNIVTVSYSIYTV
ncbi:MAG: hypothetical protein Q4C58_14215 [Eubacteriales bacterium]|nr:hypothetical protein [Eubacteriales bacterium]